MASDSHFRLNYGNDVVVDDEDDDDYHYNFDDKIKYQFIMIKWCMMGEVGVGWGDNEVFTKW